MLRFYLLLRLVVGGLSYAVPGLAGRPFGLDAGRNPQASYTARMFGSRDVAFGIGAVRATGTTRRRILQAAAACDGADAVASAIGYRAGYLSRTTAALTIAFSFMAGSVSLAAAAGTGESDGDDSRR